jgi:hypothetical protein
MNKSTVENNTYNVQNLRGCDCVDWIVINRLSQGDYVAQIQGNYNPFCAVGRP